MKIYDGSNVQALSLLELSYNNYENVLVLNETIVSTDNIIYILLKAGTIDLWGINFLLSWTQVDEIYQNILYPELAIPCEYL